MKHVIAIVDSHLSHRLAVVEALADQYEVQAYESGANAIAGMQISPPKVILMGQRVGAGNGIVVIRELRRDPFLAHIPVIFVADNEDSRTVDILRELGIKDRLVKPYARSGLMALLSKHINGRIERGWQDLPPSQRRALESSLNAFNAIADDLAHGKALPFHEVANSCDAVVEVVNSKQLGSLLEQIRDHDNFTYVHSLRFAALMALFGKAIGLPHDQQVLVASGGMLHDIGMMAIPKTVLNKEGNLTPNDWGLLRNHVTTSERLLSTGSGIPKGVATIVSHHHERLDGSGYPRKMAGNELNQLARMAGIIDVFCGLTDRRPYRRTLAPHVALELMATDMSHQLDMELLERFKEILLDSAELGLTQTAAE